MNDRTILTGLREGRPEALAALSERYRDRLVAAAQRVLGDRAEAEDVAQEAILKVRATERVPRASALARWLERVAERLALDRVRRRRTAEADDDFFVVRWWRERRARARHVVRVREAVDRLTEPYRSAVRLRYLDGLEFADIARRLDAPERTCRTWVGRGLGKLRDQLGGNDAM